MVFHPARFAYAAGVSPTAVTVYGQGGSFTSGTVNYPSGSVSASNFNNPTGIRLDSSGNLYVGDDYNNRVLYFPAGSTTATRVYGQNGSFTTNTANNGGVSANSLSSMNDLTLDSSGNLYIGDYANNRVLYFPAGSTTATRVYGQNGSFTTNTANNGGVSAKSFNASTYVALDSSGDLYVSDYFNNRVLYFPAGSTTATRVYGQGGSFTTNTANNGGVSANSLNSPQGLVVDSSSNLYVSDAGNNRILYFPAGSTTATRVYGQSGSFTTNTANSGGVAATTLDYPMGLALDSAGNLYVADNTNNRMLYFSAGSTTATRVYGQGGSFTTNVTNNGGISTTSLSHPTGVSVDSSGYIYVTDASNNRVLKFQTSLSISTQPPGTVTAPFGIAAQLIDVGSGQGHNRNGHGFTGCDAQWYYVCNSSQRCCDFYGIEHQS
jgi:sugar lactone lactonase YvrE